MNSNKSQSFLNIPYECTGLASIELLEQWSIEKAKKGSPPQPCISKPNTPVLQHSLNSLARPSQAEPIFSDHAPST